MCPNTIKFVKIQIQIINVADELKVGLSSKLRIASRGQYFQMTTLANNWAGSVICFNIITELTKTQYFHKSVMTADRASSVICNGRK